MRCPCFLIGVSRGLLFCSALKLAICWSVVGTERGTGHSTENMDNVQVQNIGDKITAIKDYLYVRRISLPPLYRHYIYRNKERKLMLLLIIFLFFILTFCAIFCLIAAFRQDSLTKQTDGLRKYIRALQRALRPQVLRSVGRFVSRHFFTNKKNSAQLILLFKKKIVLF